LIKIAGYKELMLDQPHTIWLGASRALAAQTLLSWIVLSVSYLLTEPSENVNWVYGFGDHPQRWMPERLYVLFLMVLFPLVIYLPTHVLLKTLFG